MDKRIETFSKELVKAVGFDKVMEVCDEIRKKMDAGYLKEYWYIYKHCYFYVMPIKQDTAVMRGIILERYTKERHGESYFRFLGEDGLIHNDDDDCVMGESKEKIETYLKELREDLEADGEFECYT